MTAQELNPDVGISHRSGYTVPQKAYKHLHTYKIYSSFHPAHIHTRAHTQWYTRDNVDICESSRIFCSALYRRRSVWVEECAMDVYILYESTWRTNRFPIAAAARGWMLLNTWILAQNFDGNNILDEKTEHICSNRLASTLFGRSKGNSKSFGAQTFVQVDFSCSPFFHLLLPLIFRNRKMQKKLNVSLHFSICFSSSFFVSRTGFFCACSLNRH